jgi:hypothetical protein
MTRMLRTALLATVLMAVAAPTALADSTKWEPRTLNCGSDVPMTFLVPPAFPDYAIVPFHDATSNAVLVPKIFHMTGRIPAVVATPEPARSCPCRPTAVPGSRREPCR